MSVRFDVDGVAPVGGDRRARRRDHAAAGRAAPGHRRPDAAGGRGIVAVRRDGPRSARVSAGGRRADDDGDGGLETAEDDERGDGRQ